MYEERNLPIIVVQLLSCVQLFVIPWTAAHQASLSFTISHSLLKLMSIDSMTVGTDSKESACNSGDLGSIPGLGKSPGEGMATQSSILAWRIPWTEEPGGLQSIDSQRVG